MVTSTRETERNLNMKNHELLAQITRATAKINEERIATKDKQIARLMDQVAKLKSENKDLQEAFNYVATDLKSIQA
jgi:ubiquinone biosynthesis protein UbiJ